MIADHVKDAVVFTGPSVRGPDFRRVRHIAQQVLKIAKQHDLDYSAQDVPILFAGTELGPAMLIAPVA